MNRVVLLYLSSLVLTSCASSGVLRYNCLQFEDEPSWIQVALGADQENEFISITNRVYEASEQDKSQFLMHRNTSKKRYFWYEGGNGLYLGCVILYRQNSEIKYDKKHKQGCFADRFIIDSNSNPAKATVANSLVCT